MKNFYLIICLILTFSSFAQEEEQFEKMVEAEMKSASRTINMAVNPNTLNYDVTYHKIEVTVDPAVVFVTGKVTTTYTATANMNTVTFDLHDNMIVSAVKKNGANLVFSQLGTNELVITLPSQQNSGTAATVEITYAGDPPQGQGFGSFASETHNAIPVMWTLSEPFGARDWWPCKQDLNDKINSIDVFITAPSEYVSVANGLEPEAPVVSGALKTTHFHHGYPIPAYLIAFAVTDYQVYNQQGGLGTTASPYFPIVNYLYPETATQSIASLAITPTIINFYESKFGAYPFRNEKYGHCEFGWGGGMEHTTVSFMGGFSRGLIAHEMGHQWFGNKITCGSWRDIWLNEGITEYLSGLTTEFLDGNTAFRSWKTGKITSITNHTGTTNLYLTEAQALSVNRIFSGTVTYNKGSMVTHMLRYKMGDVAFYQAMNNYLSNVNYAYKYAITPDFQGQLEGVYGGSLTEFFNDWVYGQGHPRYTITVQNVAGGQAKIVVNQTQSNAGVSYFEMPLEIRVTGAAGATQILKVNNTVNGQEFLVPLNFAITSAIFDPEKNIISKTNVITVGPNLATPNFNLEKAITISPNPAVSILEIEMPNGISFEKGIIYNIVGQKVLDSSVSSIDIETLSTGIYSIKIVTSEGSITKKFIKK